MSYPNPPTEIWQQIFKSPSTIDPPTIYESYNASYCNICGANEVILWVEPGTRGNLTNICQALNRNRNVRQLLPFLAVNHASRGAGLSVINVNDTLLRRDFYVEMQWLESLVLVVKRLYAPGLRNITTLRFDWDNFPPLTMKLGHPVPDNLLDGGFVIYNNIR